MKRIEFYMAGSTHRGLDAAYIASGEDPREALVQAVIEHISTDLEIQIGGVRIHLAAWIDPDHWAEDWAAALGDIEPDDVPEAVDAILSAAVIGEAAPE